MISLQLLKQYMKIILLILLRSDRTKYYLLRDYRNNKWAVVILIEQECEVLFAHILQWTKLIWQILQPYH